MLPPSSQVILTQCNNTKIDLRLLDCIGSEISVNFIYDVTLRAKTFVLFPMKEIRFDTKPVMSTLDGPFE